ncbi:MAG TPA: LytTR family DNA-binding domain-containing protein [Hyphomonadaceae bacterium]|nr:LytTR family DNA-binding domain-containing protein [Hyphomonadaceae bacterium]HPN06177.1 LytTR family DNA-binding domain-containing protein [Hyphomonadaceae bacterium]
MSGSRPPWAVDIAKWTAISVVLGLIFAWLGVYQTGQIPFPERFGYWTVLIAIGAGTSLIITPLLFEKWLVKFHPAVPILVASLIISLPITAGIVAIDAISDGTVSAPQWWALQYLYVLVISLILTTGAWAADRYQDQKKATADAALAAANAPSAAALAGSTFADRLPVKFRAAQVYAVSAEDHYLRVHTSTGETMILMRLADAVRELAALEGQQTHRSWWVAKQGLADVAKGDGKVTLKLKSGAEAPVSRTYQKAVKDAGWL